MAEEQNNDKQADLRWVGDLIRQAQNGDFYGRLTFIFEHGRVVRMTSEANLLPPDRKKSSGRT